MLSNYSKLCDLKHQCNNWTAKLKSFSRVSDWTLSTVFSCLLNWQTIAFEIEEIGWFQIDPDTLIPFRVAVIMIFPDLFQFRKMYFFIDVWRKNTALARLIMIFWCEIDVENSNYNELVSLQFLDMDITHPWNHDHEQKVI